MKGKIKEERTTEKWKEKGRRGPVRKGKEGAYLSR